MEHLKIEFDRVTSELFNEKVNVLTTINEK
jgi:hypothetical protein